MSMKPGATDEAGGIDALAGLRGAETSDRRNLPVPNADVQGARRCAVAVEHRPAGDDQIVCRLRSGPRAARRDEHDGQEQGSDVAGSHRRAHGNSFIGGPSRAKPSQEKGRKGGREELPHCGGLARRPTAGAGGGERVAKSRTTENAGLFVISNPLVTSAAQSAARAALQRGSEAPPLSPLLLPPVRDKRKAPQIAKSHRCTPRAPRLHLRSTNRETADALRRTFPRRLHDSLSSG